MSKGWGWLACLLLAAVVPLEVAAQEQNVAPAATDAAEFSLSDLPEEFPVPEGASVESGRTRGRHRSLTLRVSSGTFAELVRFFEVQLPEKNFRVMSQSANLDLADVDQASSFTVRASNGAVFGVLVLQKGEVLEVLLEGTF